MKRLLRHIRTYIIRGLIAAVPIALSAIAVRFLYDLVDRRVAGLFEQWLHRSIPGLGLLLAIIVLYLLGVVSSNVFGRQALRGLEWITHRIPIIRTTYQIGKQLSTALALPERQFFKRVVLIEYFRPGVWTVGFVTGTLTPADSSGEIWLKVFVPSPPNPTTGQLLLVRESQVRDPGWTVEEGLRMAVSAGILGPPRVGL